MIIIHYYIIYTCYSKNIHHLIFKEIVASMNTAVKPTSGIYPCCFFHVDKISILREKRISYISYNINKKCFVEFNKFLKFSGLIHNYVFIKSIAKCLHCQ